MSFAFHSDVLDHPVLGALSLDAFGLWVRAGTWTSAHGSRGFVPDRAILELAGKDDLAATVDEMVASGAWSRTEGGYTMEYGPSSDFPLPVWRYDDQPPANGLIDIIPEPDQ